VKRTSSILNDLFKSAMTRFMSCVASVHRLASMSREAREQHRSKHTLRSHCLFCAAASSLLTSVSALLSRIFDATHCACKTLVRQQQNFSIPASPTGIACCLSINWPGLYLRCYLIEFIGSHVCECSYLLNETVNVSSGSKPS
jgi:hypothetical protein